MEVSVVPCIMIHLFICYNVLQLNFKLFICMIVFITWVPPALRKLTNNNEGVRNLVQKMNNLSGSMEVHSSRVTVDSISKLKSDYTGEHKKCLARNIIASQS